jgi:hypothetical protein
LRHEACKTRLELFGSNCSVSNIRNTAIFHFARLALKTELMRNAYLARAFVIIPYGLYHAVPKNYVSLSWLSAAVFYFIMSLILKNKKYRWMAILTIFLAVIYVFCD